MKNICLIGLMGSGKSSTARQLGLLLNRRVLATDEMIERKEGRTIAKIFEESGESYFRKVEAEVVAAAAGEKGVIIDCGGGVVLNPKSMEALKRTGIVIYLSASIDFLYKQVKGRTHRPLLKVADPLAKMRQMFKEREALYKQADIEVVSENKTIDQIAQEIKSLVRE